GRPPARPAPPPPAAPLPPITASRKARGRGRSVPSPCSRSGEPPASRRRSENGGHEARRSLAHQESRKMPWHSVQLPLSLLAAFLISSGFLVFRASAISRDDLYMSSISSFHFLGVLAPIGD